MIAFEPQPRLARLLRRSFEAGGLDADGVYEIALFDREDVLEFHVPEHRSGAASLFNPARPGERAQVHRVRAARLDDVLANEALPGRVVLKLDVEGSEIAVLNGARTLIHQYRPTLVLEVNPTTTGAAGRTVAELVAELIAIGYVAHASIERPHVRRPITEIDMSRQTNVLVYAG